MKYAVAAIEYDSGYPNTMIAVVDDKECAIAIAKKFRADWSARPDVSDYYYGFIVIPFQGDGVFYNCTAEIEPIWKPGDPLPERQDNMIF